MPLDFETDAFYVARRKRIDAQLGAIGQGEFQSIFTQVWDVHYGEMCRGVNWEMHSCHEWREIMGCIGGKKLESMCRLFAEDYKAVSGNLLPAVTSKAKGERPRWSARFISMECRGVSM